MKRLNKNQHKNFTFVKIFVAIVLGLLLTQMVKSNLQEDAFSRLQNVEEVSEEISNTEFAPNSKGVLTYFMNLIF